MPDYGNYCPVSMGTDVLADRWTPLVVRELFMGSTRFNDIARGLPGISRSLLVQRLKHLERKGVLETWPASSGRGNEYRLTPAGKDLAQVVVALGQWAVQWLFHELDPHDVDAATLMWWMHRMINVEELPPTRVVIQFDHLSPEVTTLWLVLDRGESSVCMQHPGFDVDVVVRSTTQVLGEVFGGHAEWSRCVAAGDIAVDGPPRLTKALPRWFLWSPFAPDIRARRAALALG